METWKTIECLDKYEVSTAGRIRNKNTGRILKTRIHKKGYEQVSLYINGKQKKRNVHRLVAEAFIPNPLNKSDVNHIDECRSNNTVENLNWMTHKENINWGTRIVKLSKPIIAIYPDNTYEEFSSTAIAAKELELDRGNITRVLKGERSKAGGIIFEYLEENKNVKEIYGRTVS